MMRTLLPSANGGGVEGGHFASSLVGSFSVLLMAVSSEDYAKILAWGSDGAGLHRP